jgi:hypothetical protein
MASVSTAQFSSSHKNPPNSPSPSKFDRIRALTRKVAVPFQGAVARQNSGLMLQTEGLMANPGFQHPPPASPTPQGRAKRHYRSQGEPSGLVLDTPVASHQHDSTQEKLFSSDNGDSDAAPPTEFTAQILKPSGQVGPGASSHRHRAQVIAFSGNGRPFLGKSAVFGNSATPEPSPATSKTSRVLSESVGPVSEKGNRLQGKQKSVFQPKDKAPAISAQIEVSSQPPLTQAVFQPALQQTYHSQRVLTTSGPQEQPGQGTRRTVGSLPQSNPSRLGPQVAPSTPVRAGPAQPPATPRRDRNFFAPLEEFPALPSAPSSTPSRTAQRRRRESSGSEAEQTVKMRLLRRSDISPPHVDKVRPSRRTASSGPTVAFVTEDTEMSESIMEVDLEQPAVSPLLTYAQAAVSTTEAPPSPAPSGDTFLANRATEMLQEAEQMLSTSLILIEQATSLGATMSPKLKRLLRKLGPKSAKRDDELLKKVGDLVESKLAAFMQAPTPPKPTTVKSANPVPIRPTPPPKPKPATPKSGAMRHHPTRLILQVLNPGMHRSKPPVVAARDAVNQALQDHNLAPRVAGVTYTAAGNIVIIARPPHTAQDLLPLSEGIGQVILGDQAECRGREDLPWFRVQVNTVPVYYQGEVVSPEAVLDELRWALGDGDFLSPSMMATSPRWMCAPTELAKKNHASVVFSFLREEDAQRFKAAGAYLLWGKWCRTAAYEDRPQVRFCAHCWSIEHITTACRRQLPRCRLCAGDHTTDSHQCEQCGDTEEGCEHFPLKCCNCKGQHVANAYNCPERKRKLGQFAQKTPAPVRRQAAPAANVSRPAPSGNEWQTVQPAGGRKTKGKRKSKAQNATQLPAAPTIVQQEEHWTPSAPPHRTLRRTHSDPNLTPGHMAASQKRMWSDDVDDEMDEDYAPSLFNVPVPTNEEDLPDLD